MQKIRDLKFLNTSQANWKDWKNTRFLKRSIFEWMVILGVLLLSVQMGRMASTWLLKIVIILAGGIAFSIIALRNMPLALSLVLLTSATSGVVIGTGRTSALPAGLIMIAFLSAIWVYKMMFFERGIHIKPSPLNLPILAFLVSALISWLIGYVIWDWKVVVTKNIFNVQAGQYALFLFSFAAMYLTAHQDLNEKHLKSWLVIIVIIGMGEIIVEYFLGNLGGRNNGILGSLFIFPLVLLAAQFLFNPELSTGGRLATIAAAGIWLLWAYNNLDYKGVWVPALIGVAIVVLIRNWKLTLVGAIAAAMVVILEWDALNATLFAPEFGSNSFIRPLIWKDIASMVLPRSPLFGLGLANYFYYWNDPSLLPASRIAAGWYKWNTWGYAIPSHNMFMDVFAQTGIIGLIFFLWGMGAALWMVYRVIRLLKPGFLRAYTIGVGTGFAAMLVGSFLFADWLIPFVYNISITGFRHSVYSWILLGTVLGMYYRLEDREELEDATAEK